MRIRSRERRMVWVSLLLAPVPDAILVGLISRLANVEFLWAAGAVVAAYVYMVVRGVLGAVLGWVAFAGGLRRQSSGHLFEWLVENHFPEPEGDIVSAESYLAAVAEGAEVPIHLRLKAARELGSLDAISGIVARLQTTQAWEDAVGRYRTWLLAAAERSPA